jgi:NodT family efflux transporter outer membrane factor (OMF) lipoprotein
MGSGAKPRFSDALAWRRWLVQGETGPGMPEPKVGDWMTHAGKGRPGSAGRITRRILVRGSSVLASTILLAGCTVMGPDFKSPEWASPASWFSPSRPKVPVVASLPAAEPINPDWWRLFNDPLLTGLIERVASENLDVRIAAMRLEESRYQLAIAEASEVPRINAGGGYIRQKSSRYGILTANQPNAENANGTSGLGVTGSPTRRYEPYDIFQGGFDASWEVDLWGKVARSIEAANATSQAAAEAQRGVLLTTIAEVARDYVQLRGAQAQLGIARDNLRTQQRTLELTRQRAAGGLTTDLDVANASAQVGRTASEIPLLQQREAALINALSQLLGQPPNALRTELETVKPLPPVPPTVPVGLPSELVRRRPDVRQVEAVLHAATASIGVAQAEFYPSFRLTGSAGVQALQFGQLFNLAAGTFALGPSVTVPIFEGGRLKANLSLQEAFQKEAAIQYQKTVLQAWHEVDNALTAYQTEQARRDQLTQAVADNRRAVGLARSRYEQGVADFLTVLETERLLLATQQQLQASTTNVSEYLVALYKALGGGWETDLPEVAQVPAAAPEK